MNLTQINDEDPTLLLAKCREKQGESVLLNEGKVFPAVGQSSVTRARQMFGTWTTGLAII